VQDDEGPILRLEAAEGSFHESAVIEVMHLSVR